MTLLPDQRMLLSDALTPPEGFEFDAAVAVTYSLDLRALLAAPLALSRGGAADAGVAAVDAAIAVSSEAAQTPVGLTAALKRCADKLTVFVQAGHVAAPAASHPVLSFLEDCVIGVNAPRGGVVHAKAWVLRYRSSGNPAAAADGGCLRVLISSRNLTWDRSWDTVVRFDAFLDDAVPERASDPSWVSMDPLADIFESLLAQAESNIRAAPPGRAQARRERIKAHRERVVSLCRDLRDAGFACPDGFDRGELHALGIAADELRGSDRAFFRPFPDDASRALVISPFVRRGFFDNVLPGSAAELVAREQELRDLAIECLRADGHLDKTWVFDGTGGDESDDAGEGADDDAAGGSRAGPDDDSSDNPAAPATQETSSPSLRDLHAKLYLFDRQRQGRQSPRSSLFLGSANATNSAFSRNVELLLQLDGPTCKVGIDALVGPPHADRTGEVALRDLFTPYEPPGDPEPVMDSGFDTDAECRHLATTLALTSEVSQSGDRVTLRIRSADPVSLSDGHGAGGGPVSGGARCDESGQGAAWSITGRPLSPVPPRTLQIGIPLDLTFEVGLADVSRWFRVEVTAPDGTSKATLLPVEIVAAPADFEAARETAIMRSLIGNSGRLMEYLAEMLRSGQQPITAGQFDVSVELPASSEFEDAAGETRRAATTAPVLEAMLRTLRTDPERLRRQRPLVDSFAGQGSEELSSDGLFQRFKVVWRAAMEAADDAFRPNSPGDLGRTQDGRP